MRPAAQQVEAQLGDDPVFAHERYDVCQGPDGRDLEECRQPFLLPVRGAETLNELQRHAHAGEVLVGIRAIVPLGIDDGNRRRQLGARLVVIRDDQVEAQFPRADRRFHAADAAVDGDAQLRALGVQPVDGGWLQPVAVAQALWNEVADVAA